MEKEEVDHEAFMVKAIKDKTKHIIPAHQASDVLETLSNLERDYQEMKEKIDNATELRGGIPCSELKSVYKSNSKELRISEETLQAMERACPDHPQQKAQTQ
ncbi:unnamed protein product [Blepharisma stoltei]|uniref:Uncharacterized protein n=1 Tax=Blepharisma stoltei TaxID=1481888 RepID=A0AAU9JHP5_9CILI|nr:unnamed protein product [Blepharisma stoltei]